MARTKTEADAVVCSPLDAWFAINAKEMRLHRRLTQEKLGEFVGMAKSCIWRLESRRHSATLATANAIATALGCDLVQMLVSPAKFKETLK